MDYEREIESLKQRIAALRNPQLFDWGMVYDTLWEMAKTINQSEESFVMEVGLRDEYIERMRNQSARRYL
jgi:hypothetical protein